MKHGGRWLCLQCFLRRIELLRQAEAEALSRELIEDSQRRFEEKS